MIIDISGEYIIKASDFHKNATIDVSSILELDTFVPPLKFYLFGDSRMTQITNSITYNENNPSDQLYRHVRNGEGAIGGVVIGTLKDAIDLKNDINFVINDISGNIRLYNNSGREFYAGGVNYETGYVNNTSSDTSDIVSYTKPGERHYRDPGSWMSYAWTAYGIPSKTNTPDLEYVVNYSTTGRLIQKLYYNNDGVLFSKLQQYGIESPHVNAASKQTRSGNSVKIGTPGYAAFCARIPYAFINMYHHFYIPMQQQFLSSNYKLSQTKDKITIDINNNGVILYIPRLSIMGTLTNGIYDMSDTIGSNGLLNYVDITFIGSNSVIFCMPSDDINNSNPGSHNYISDGNYYRGHTVVGDSQDVTTLYFNGNNTQKYQFKIYANTQETYRINVIRENVKYGNNNKSKTVIRLHINKNL